MAKAGLFAVVGLAVTTRGNWIAVITLRARAGLTGSTAGRGARVFPGLGVHVA